MLPQIIRDNTDRETREALETVQEQLPNEFMIIRNELEYLYQIKDAANNSQRDIS
jgi:hypothetical protein